MLAVGVERPRWALCVCYLLGVGVYGSEGGEGEGGQRKQGVAEAGLVGVGNRVSGRHGTMPSLSDPSPHTPSCLGGDAQWPLTG